MVNLQLDNLAPNEKINNYLWQNINENNKVQSNVNQIKPNNLSIFPNLGLNPNQLNLKQ